MRRATASLLPNLTCDAQPVQSENLPQVVAGITEACESFRDLRNLLGSDERTSPWIALCVVAEKMRRGGKRRFDLLLIEDVVQTDADVVNAGELRDVVDRAGDRVARYIGVKCADPVDSY